MAKIMNLELKGFKEFEGHDGYGFNANLYYNGKKVAHCHDDACGGCLDIIWFIDADKREDVFKSIKEYYTKYPAYMLHENDYGITEQFINEFVGILRFEKWYKKMLKNGYTVAVTINYNKRTTPLLKRDFTTEDIYVAYLKWDKQTEKSMKAMYSPVEYTVYKSLDDLIIK
ncbi:MAG: hypothetical protein K0R54_520 [Clostridiaceae bacterium]|jgi:hypothetical protein|nr:hypothetical protein [Clostridiaceae bacterium]